jgi:hypothetical protein
VASRAKCSAGRDGWPPEVDFRLRVLGRKKACLYRINYSNYKSITGSSLPGPNTSK